MANTTRLVAGAYATYTAAAFNASDCNSLPPGGGALSTTIIPNATNLDTYMDVSFAVTIGDVTEISFLTLYLLPLNQDGTTYGDGYASSTTAEPSPSYNVGAVVVPANLSAGAVVTGTFRGIDLPPSNFVLAISNDLGVPFYTTAALSVKFKTYNINLNA